MSAPAPSMYSPAAAELAASLGLKLGRPNLEEFADALAQLAKEDGNVLAVTSDSRGSAKLAGFATAFPKQLVELGIAEQNLVGVAAGLASAGKTVFAVSPACFLTARALEQIKNDCAYSNNPVNLTGISAGVSYGALGSTHHSLHDLAALRAINNLDIIVPADAFETRQAVSAAAASHRPMYLRFGKAPIYRIHETAAKFDLGKAIDIREGKDLVFIATGETVIHALLAAELLKQKGLSCGVISMHTIKPLDAETVSRAARRYKAIVTVEEHSIHGGLGEACAALLLQASISIPFKIIGIPDEETVTGSQADIFRHYGITMENLAATATALLR